MDPGFSIKSDKVYVDGDIVLGLGLTSTALARARRSGALRFTRKGRKVLYRGRWLLDWLESTPTSPGVRHAK